MTTGNVLSLSADIISCTLQFPLCWCVGACGCVGGMLISTARGILLQLTSVSGRCPAGSVGSFIMYPLLTFATLRKSRSSTNSCFFSCLCPVDGFWWALFVSIRSSFSLHSHISHIEQKICLFVCLFQLSAPTQLTGRICGMINETLSEPICVCVCVSCICVFLFEFPDNWQVNDHLEVLFWKVVRNSPRWVQGLS